MTPPLVSVCIVTYQHARFVGHAIDGALRQNTNFPVEILIGEDESTDGTREICLNYALRFPDQVKVLLHRRRDVVFIDGQPRGSHNLNETIRAARGEFVALCEGDDFWTSPDKLQLQVDYLRQNPDCVACFHDTTLVDADGVTLKPSYFQAKQSKFDQRDVLDALMSSFATCSLVFRRKAYFPLPAWFLRRPCDLYLDLHLTASGSLGFINRCLGAYRRHGGGIWSSQREAIQVVELIIRYKLLLADEFFFANFRELLVRKISEFQALLFTRADAADEIARLESIVTEQLQALNATRMECERLSREGQEVRLGQDALLHEAQGHINALKLQLDGLAATAQRQKEYIAVLESERQRLAADVTASVKGSGPTLELRQEADHLAATTQSQFAYITVLEKERDRLQVLATSSSQENEHYVKVMYEQAAYIESLKQQLATSRAS